MPYENQPIQPLNLYVVKNNNHALNIQSHALYYGKFIPENAEILAAKQPSFIKKVNFKKSY